MSVDILLLSGDALLPLGLLTLSVVVITYYGYREYLERRRRPSHRFSRARHGKLLMSKQLNVGGTTTATVTYTDKADATVALPAGNVPAWSVDQASIATVSPAPDGMTAVVTAVAAGTATITVVAEGDPTPGVDTITLTGIVNVVDEASGGTLTFN